MGVGFWKVAPANCGGGRMRLVNNTQHCTGPWLAIYEEEAPALSWAEMPEEYIDEAGTGVVLCA